MMKMRLLMVWTGTLLLCACSTVSVSQDYRPGTDFSNLKTYRWQLVAHDIQGDEPMDDPLRDERIRNAVERNLTSLGFREVISAKPDFLIDFQYSVYRVMESNNVRGKVGIGTWGGANGTYGGIGVGTGRGLYTREDGQLRIDVIDPKNGHILWRGKGTHQVEPHWQPETKIEKTDELVDKVLAQFPPAFNP
jgi:hypothetical protein